MGAKFCLFNEFLVWRRRFLFVLEDFMRTAAKLYQFVLFVSDITKV